MGLLSMTQASLPSSKPPIAKGEFTRLSNKFNYVAPFSIPL